MKPEESATTGADLLVKALIDEEVEVVFGYPGGAVLPIYDFLFKQNRLRHILVRHEQAAVHAAEGYARSTGKVGVVLVTSGPGATNAVTGLTDALMDSHSDRLPDRPGADPSDRQRRLPGSRHDRHHAALHQAQLPGEGGRRSGAHRPRGVLRRPLGPTRPVVIDLPKDVLMNKHDYTAPKKPVQHKSYRPQVKPELKKVEEAIELIAGAKRPIFYAGGGIVNAGPKASKLLTQFVHMTGYPITNTLMGLGTFPASDKQFLGMLGMHGTYEANLAMYHCDVMINIGARFDDRITGKLTEFSPKSKKIHVDIDPSSINKNVRVDLPIVGDAGHVLEDMIRVWKARQPKVDHKALKAWWAEIDKWRARDCLAYKQDKETIKPQYALERLYHHIKDRDHYITTEVGQHQMWAAQFLKFEQPNRWMTSGGLGTMGYGFPSAMGVQIAHPDALVIDVAGEASIMMNIQELSTVAQYRLPVKIFILQQPVHGHGAPVAGAAAWRPLFRELHGIAARLREACRGVRRGRPALPRPGQARRHDQADDRHQEAGGRRRAGRQDRELLPDDPVGCRPLRHAAGARRSGRQAGVGGRHGAGVSTPETSSHTISVLVDNEPGILARVVGLFSGRGYNIESLTVAETDAKENLSRITIVTAGTPMVIEQIKAQLDRLVPVHRVRDLTVEGPHIERELALVKVKGTGDKRVEALRLADVFRAKVIDAKTDSFVFEVTGTSDKVRTFVGLMEGLGLVELGRTGIVAMSRGGEAL